MQPLKVYLHNGSHWGMVTTQMYYNSAGRDWGKQEALLLPSTSQLWPHGNMTVNKAAQLCKAGEHLQPTNRWGLQLSEVGLFTAGRHIWQPCRGNRCPRPCLIYAHLHLRKTSEVISACFLRKLHIGSLPPSPMPSQIRKTRSQGLGMKDPGGT